MLLTSKEGHILYLHNYLWWVDTTICLVRNFEIPFISIKIFGDLRRFHELEINHRASQTPKRLQWWSHGDWGGYMVKSQLWPSLNHLVREEPWWNIGISKELQQKTRNHRNLRPGSLLQSNPFSQRKNLEKNIIGLLVSCLEQLLQKWQC